jgi:hypothetical protein
VIDSYTITSALLKKIFVSHREASVCVELIGEKVERTVQFLG